MLLSTIVASLLGNMLASKGVTRSRQGTIRAGEGVTWAGKRTVKPVECPIEVAMQDGTTGQNF